MAKNRWCVVWFVCMAQVAFGQMPNYPFVVDSMNTIQIPSGKSERIECLYTKMNAVFTGKGGQLSVLHIGGSHIQADLLTHQVRSHFDSLFEGTHTSRGMIFPFEAARTNNPWNYTVSHKGTWERSRNVNEERRAALGVTGIAVTTVDSVAEITVNVNTEKEQHRWKFSRLTVLGSAESPLVEPVLLVRDSLFRAEYDSARSVYVYTLPFEAETFTLKIEQRDTVMHAFTVNGFLVENNNPGVVYHAIGVNGASVSSYLSCENFERDLALIHPDLIVFAIGINDAFSDAFSDSAFIAQYDSLIVKIERVVPECAYFFVTNNDSFRSIKTAKSSYYQVNQNGLSVQRDFYELAAKHHGGVWDMFAIMGGLNSMKQWEAMGLAKKDKIHFTYKGYRFLGDLFFKALIESYNKTMVERQW